VKALRLVVNVAAYQCAWFACVLGAAAQRPALGLAVVLAAVLWHLYCARLPGRELRLIAIAVLCGLTFESVLVASGWVRMEPAVLVGSFTPLWMVALWAAFATTLNVSLRNLRSRYLLATVLAGLGAPLAYFAGASLGALQWVNATAALLLIAAGWALMTPLLMKAAQTYDGFAAA
jgi:Protein of unknown function (DUF2878)